jgi:flagellar basal-body rod protein FlgB
MDLQKMHVFHAAQKKMDWIAQRQKVLSQNVANANTPNYQPKDLKSLKFQDLLAPKTTPQLQMSATANTHLKGTIPEKGPYNEKTEQKTFETSITGNGVVIEEQMQKIGQNRGQYELTTSLYKKNLNLFKTALGTNR